MASEIRLSYTVALVLLAIDCDFRFGFDIMDATGLPSGTVYPALRRLENAGAITATWESAKQAARENRPPRRYYKLTREGREMLAGTQARYVLPELASPGALRAALEEVEP
jgi:DNA-binding PadR family transcriptional regulator